MATLLAWVRPHPDVVVLAVKAYDCAGAAETIRQGLPADVPVVCVLNGIGNEATLAAALGAQRVIAASLTSAIQRLDAGAVRASRRRAASDCPPATPVGPCPRISLRPGFSRGCTPTPIA